MLRSAAYSATRSTTIVTPGGRLAVVIRPLTHRPGATRDGWSTGRHDRIGRQASARARRYGRTTSDRRDSRPPRLPSHAGRLQTYAAQATAQASAVQAASPRTTPPLATANPLMATMAVPIPVAILAGFIIPGTGVLSGPPPP